MSLGLQTVSSLERCPLFRVSFIERFHCALLLNAISPLFHRIGESIPIRLFLGAVELGTTMKDVCRKFSVRYFLNLVLVDEEDRRYFKQQEIILWRKAEQKTAKKSQKR